VTETSGRLDEPFARLLEILLADEKDGFVTTVTSLAFPGITGHVSVTGSKIHISILAAGRNDAVITI
jgi:hypothetical protein